MENSELNTVEEIMDILNKGSFQMLSGGEAAYVKSLLENRKMELESAKN